MKNVSVFASFSELLCKLLCFLSLFHRVGSVKAEFVFHLQREMLPEFISRLID